MVTQLEPEGKVKQPDSRALDPQPVCSTIPIVGLTCRRLRVVGTGVWTQPKDQENICILKEVSNHRLPQSQFQSWSIRGL